MTREERELSIEYLEGIKDNYIEGHGYERHPVPEYYAIENAIKALEQETCEVAISKQAVLETIDDCNSDGLKGIFCSYDGGERFKEYIKNLPPVTPRPKMGHWIWIVDESPATPISSYELNWAGWACDCCREQPNDDSDWDDWDNPPKYKYCPNCGAKMGD